CVFCSFSATPRARLLSVVLPCRLLTVYFFNICTPPPEFYTLSLHDALPISRPGRCGPARARGGRAAPAVAPRLRGAAGDATFSRDRKSTRLNSSHVKISYAVFCLKKKIEACTSAF